MLETAGFSIFLIIPLAIILILIGVTIWFFKRKSKRDRNF
ncbi:PEP-CTERM protein-sorting domain-containing protein [[Bacillus] enclensis]|uniref:PEP-CTERM protein-sorting domain-containing protein n=1 Tax=[Bacillus] enclensis TaxID=1402860 RepID=A0A1C4BYW6_9BACI|nr:PEP-CTERM protein-sorting domain-containing protein [[Bacillus] enclensis]